MARFQVKKQLVTIDSSIDFSIDFEKKTFFFKNATFLLIFRLESENTNLLIFRMVFKGINRLLIFSIAIDFFQ